MTTNAFAEEAPPSIGQTLVAFLRREWPYVLMIVLSMVGVAYTSLLPEASFRYWQILAPIFGVICVVTRWPNAYAEGRHWRLTITQILHWGVFALSMQLWFLPAVQRSLDAFVSGLVVLYLLAMGTFLVGVYYLAWRLCVVGLFLGLAIPAIALLDEAALLLLALAVLLIAGAYLYSRFAPKRDDWA